MPVGGRVAKSGYTNTFSGTGKMSNPLNPLNHSFTITITTGRSYNDINEELWLTSIAMAVVILILIAMALLYILYEKCQKKREHFINA